MTIRFPYLSHIVPSRKAKILSFFSRIYLTYLVSKQTIYHQTPKMPNIPHPFAFSLSRFSLALQPACHCEAQRAVAIRFPHLYEKPSGKYEKNLSKICLCVTHISGTLPMCVIKIPSHTLSLHQSLSHSLSLYQPLSLPLSLSPSPYPSHEHLLDHHWILIGCLLDAYWICIGCLMDPIHI